MIHRLQLCLFFILFHLSTSHNFNLTIEQHGSLDNFRVGQTRNITLSITSDDVIHEADVFCVDKSICRVSHIDKITTIRQLDGSQQEVFNVTIEAVFLGITQLQVKLHDTELDIPETSVVIRVMRAHFYVVFANIFVATAGTFVVCVTFLMGTQLKWTKIRQVLRRPIGPIIGFVCQFILMPMIGYLLAEYGLREEDVVLKLALFAASTCPGGGKSPFWTIIYNGSLDLSVAMTFTQTLAALFMMPLWLSTVGKKFTTSRVDVPFLAIIEGLVVLIVPSAAGMYFIHSRPHLIQQIDKYIKVATWTATIFFTFFGAFANWYIFFLFTWRTVFIGCLLPWSGYIISYFIAYVCGQGEKEKKTIAIETGIQNVGIATMLMLWSLPEPEVDISLTILIVIMLSTDKPLMILWLIQNYFNKKETIKSKYETGIDHVEISIGSRNAAYVEDDDNADNKNQRSS